jgi:hypothetical protein
MRKRNTTAMLAFGFLLSVAAPAGDRVHIRWVITPDQNEKVERSRAERLYDEACRWIEDRFDANGEAIRPRLSVHVGEACPDRQLRGACLSPASGVLYIPEWNEASPGHIIHATVVVGLLQLLEREDMRGVVNFLLTRDAHNFLDAESAVRRSKQD